MTITVTPQTFSYVSFDADLRTITEAAAVRLREIVDTKITPKALYDPARCDECSLLTSCRPRAAEKRVDRYLEAAFRRALSGEKP